MSGPISVIVPVRDGEPYLADALGSILAQRPRPEQVIVVDDGSADRSAAIAAGFEAPVRVIRQPARGLAAALNHGVAGATGEYLAFLDADDLWPPGSLASRLDALEADPSLDAVFGLVSHFYSPELTAGERASLALPDPDQPARLRGGLLIRSGAHGRVGEVDERWGLVSFIDWWARAEEAGLRGPIIGASVLERRLHSKNWARGPDGRGKYAEVIKAVLDRRRARAER